MLFCHCENIFLEANMFHYIKLSTITFVCEVILIKLHFMEFVYVRLHASIALSSNMVKMNFIVWICQVCFFNEIALIWICHFSIVFQIEVNDVSKEMDLDLIKQNSQVWCPSFYPFSCYVSLSIFFMTIIIFLLLLLLFSSYSF